VGSVYVPAVTRERKTWLDNWIEWEEKEELRLDILGGDFNMIRDRKLDRSDEGIGVAASPGMARWLLIEKDMGLVDGVRLRRREESGLFTRWHKVGDNLVGSRIDWIMVGEQWGNVLDRVEVRWCPWSDHWGAEAVGSFGGSKSGGGCWRLNVSLLRRKTERERFVAVAQREIRRWKAEGRPIREWWGRFKSLTGAFWQDVGEVAGKEQKDKE